MSIKINTPAIKIVKSTFTRVVRLIIVSRWQPLLLQFQTTEAVTRLQIRIYNANLWTAGAAEIKMHYTAQSGEYWTRLFEHRYSAAVGHICCSSCRPLVRLFKRQFRRL